MVVRTIWPFRYGRKSKMIKIGDVLSNRYRITGRIGTGGTAEVYLATDFIKKQTVAVKIIKEELLNDPRSVARFEHEAAACASFNHQNIVKVFNQGQVNGCSYLIFEYVKGQTLFDRLDFQATFSLKEASEIMLQLLDAISYIHERGVVHRDIKPQNIFYLANGTVKLADFGIAQSVEEDDSNQGVFGSVYYLAPEVCVGEQASIQSDIYSCGVTYYQLLTGRLPFEDGSTRDIAAAHVKRNFPHLSKFQPEIAGVFDKIIQKACAKNPLDRYQSAKEMAKDISDAISNKDNLKEHKNIFQKIFGFK